jgi:hypothetical protein
VELLLLRRRDTLTWEALVGGKGLRIGKKVRVEDGPAAEIIELLDGRAGNPICRTYRTVFSKVGNLRSYIHEAERP